MVLDVPLNVLSNKYVPIECRRILNKLIDAITYDLVNLSMFITCYRLLNEVKVFDII